MICPNCGTNLDDNATECFLCGCHIVEQTISVDKQNYSVNTCPVCGSEISEQECVCSICGSPIEKISQTENNQEEYNTENIEKSEPQNRSNKNLIIIIIAVAVAAIIGILVFLFLGKGDTKDVQSNVSQTEATTTLTTESTTETSTETTATSTTTEATTTVTTEIITTTETYADVSSYVGFWHKESVGYERELTISSVKRNNIIFSLWYYRTDSIEDVPATLEDNTAYFDTGDVQGYLTFEDNIITVVITNSSRPYMPSEVMTFDGRHEHSWEYEEFDTTAVFEPYIIEVTNPKLSIYDAPSYSANIVGEITDKSRYTIVEEYIEPGQTSIGYIWGKLKSGVGWINMYDATIVDDSFYEEETPNVWCPNCGYGFFTTGVGTEGFNCPACGHNWLP